MTSHEERRPRIIVADDHPHVLAAIGRLLQPSCDVVASVATGKEAIDAAGGLKPDVLIVDLMMPDLDGLEVCRKVKQESPATDVVIIAPSRDGGELVAAARRHATPNMILALFADGADVPADHPAAGKSSVAGRATAYVCRGETCSLPVTDTPALVALLG